MTYQPREIPEEVNVTKIHPLVNFGNLLGTIAVFGISGYFALGLVANQLVTRISPEREHKMGLNMVKGSVVKPEKLSANQKKQLKHLQDLLVELNDGAASRSIPLQIHLIKDKRPNAFAFPGGQIAVTTGFLAEAESENEVAFVLAHELGHHVEKDALRSMGRSLVLVFVSTVIGIGTGSGDFVINAGNLGNLHYSRKQEAIADLFALETIVDHYGHGEASLDFFERIEAENKDRRSKIGSYFSTHPLTEDRINDLQQVALEKNWAMTGEVTELPPEIFTNQDQDHKK